jgi:hypothetical protein
MGPPSPSDDDIEGENESEQRDEVEEDILDEDESAGEEDVVTFEMGMEEEQIDFPRDSIEEFLPSQEEPDERLAKPTGQSLYNAADAGLREILDQRGATEADCNATLSAFQRYISLPGRDLAMNEDDTGRYP